MDIYEHVVFWGRVSQEKKLELMRKAHLLLHASVKEGWGLVVLEAASQGTPAVVYKVAGLVDSVIDGKTGIVLSKNSPEILAKHSLNIYNDKRKYHAMQQAGLTWVASLSWEVIAKQSIKLISSV